jgi:rRNA-processing protein FCF1
LPFRVRFPLLAEVDRLVPGARIAVPSSVRNEVDRLAERGVTGAAAASAFAARFPTVRTAGRGDDGVLRAARYARAAVVTADRALAVRLRSEGVTVLVPRDRHRLELRPAVRAAPSTPGVGNG